MVIVSAVFELVVECDYAAPGERASDTLESYAVVSDMVRARWCDLF